MGLLTACINEIDKLSIEDIKQLEEEAMQKMPGKSQKMLLTEYGMNLGQLEILSSHLIQQEKTNSFSSMLSTS